MTENILWKVNPSQLVNWPRYLIYSFFGLSWLFLPNEYINFTIYMPFKILHICILITIVNLWAALITYLSSRCTKYELTNERFLLHSGIFTRKRDVMELYRIVDYSVLSPFYIRLFGYSNITLFTSDKTNPTLNLVGIKNAYQIENIIRGRVEEMRRIKQVRVFE